MKNASTADGKKTIIADYGQTIERNKCDIRDFGNDLPSVDILCLSYTNVVLTEGKWKIST